MKFKRINPALKARWVNALRSGYYKQGKRALQTEDGCNCCLGVLARIEDVPLTVKTWGEIHGDEEMEDKTYCGTFFDFDGYSDDGFPPAGWKGLSQDMQSFVAEMNDTGKTFEEIAAYIEENF